MNQPQPAIPRPRARPAVAARRAAVSPAAAEPATAKPAAANAARYVADTSALAGGDPLQPALMDSLSAVKALAVREPTPAPKPYAKADLQAIAELAYHYLFAGAHTVAHVLYEGVASLAPAEPAFQLGLGLALDKLGEKQKARAAYARAAALDPGDPRAEINLAELLLEEGQFAAAKQHLARAVKKADARNDRALGDKARAIHRHLA